MCVSPQGDVHTVLQPIRHQLHHQVVCRSWRRWIIHRPSLVLWRRTQNSNRAETLKSLQVESEFLGVDEEERDLLKTVLDTEKVRERDGTDPWRVVPSSQFTDQTAVLHVSEWDGSQVVLLDAGVAPLGCRGVSGLPSRSRDVHADHVPEVTLQRPTVVVQRACGGRLGHWLRFHHGHGDRGWLLRAAAVRHGAADEKKKTRVRDHLRSATHQNPTQILWDFQDLLGIPGSLGSDFRWLKVPF